MLKIEVDRHSKEPDKIIGCGTTQDILLELGMVISSISRELAQPLSDKKEYEKMTYMIMASVTAGVRHGLHAAVKDLDEKEAASDG